MGLQGWPLKLVQHIADATCVPPSPAGPPSSCPLHLLYLLNLKFVIGIPNRCCILELRSNQCFVCNFLCMLSIKLCSCFFLKPWVYVHVKITLIYYSVNCIFIMIIDYCGKR